MTGVRVKTVFFVFFFRVPGREKSDDIDHFILRTIHTAFHTENYPSIRPNARTQIEMYVSIAWWDIPFPFIRSYNISACEDFERKGVFVTIVFTALP